jgi:hypothetical protein
MSTVSQFRDARFYGTGKTKITLGPFTGGINKSKDPNFLLPNELQECVNYIIRPNGRLVGRPPVKAYGTPQGLPAGFNVSIVGIGAGGNFRAGTAFNGPLVFDYQNLRFWLYNVLTDTWQITYAALPGTIDTIINVASYIFASYALAWDSLNSTNKLLLLNPMTNISAFTTLYGTIPGLGSALVNGNLLFHKDRAVVVADRLIMWSKATDPAVWAVPDGGYVKFSGDATGGSFVFQDAIYIVGDSGIWRYTWVSDPSIDESLEHIFTESVFSSVVYNNEIYIATAKGIFKYLNGYLVEISEAISPDWINKVKALTGSSQPAISILEDFLLAGPFGTTTQFYYVYNFKTQIWTSWQFGSGSNVVRGPFPLTGPITSAGTSYNIGVKKWLWSANGVPYSLPADGLTGGAVYGGYDSNAAGNNFWMGFKFTTAEIDLGDGLRWKRVFRSLIDGIYNAVTFTVGTSKINMLADSVATVLSPPDSGKLSWGKSFRAKRIALQYDSTGNTIGTGTTPTVELNNVDRVQVYIRAAEEVTT